MNLDKEVPKINLLGIPLTVLSRKDLLRVAEEMIGQASCQYYAVTPNPEIILGALKDEELFYILNKADLSIPDGIGLKFAALACGRRIPRIAGADFTRQLLRLAEKKNYKVGIFNWCEGLSCANDIEKALREKYPDLQFVVEDIEREWQMPYYKRINAFQPELVFAALGSPWQEKFIYHGMEKMPYVRLAVGVGGSFDFLTGKVSRAPWLVRQVGLEWVWRFLQQSKGTRLWRLKRIFNAVVVFPSYFLKWRFINPFLYRKNVACLVYKKEYTEDTGKPVFKILLLERKEEPGHWQLPQGGREGEDIKTAGLRELSEEINCSRLRPVAVFGNLYKYRFGKRKGEEKGRKKRVSQHYNYRGQTQGLLIAEFKGKEDDIMVNYWEHSAWRWVDRENVFKEVHPIRKDQVKIVLEKFNAIINDSNYEV